MTDSHADWVERSLALEDLEGPDREATLVHLQACPECRSLREALLAREAQARPAGSLPPPERWDALALDDVSRAGERRSLAALLERERSLGSERPARRPALRWLVPAAAAAAIVAVLWTRTPPPAPPAPAPSGTPAPAPPLAEPSARITGLTIAPGPGLRGGAEAGWRTGDAFTLRFTLERAASVVVVHVDPQGVAALLVPDSPAEPAPRLGPGEVTLPDPASGERWTFEGEPGAESFLIASFTRPPDVRALALSLPMEPAADREVRVRDVVRVLAGAGASVERADASHARPR